MAPISWHRNGLAPDPLAEVPICRVATAQTAIAPGKSPRDIRITFSPNALCSVGIPVAEELGFFARRNIRIEKVNTSTAADQLLEFLASGKVDAGVGMALAWLKPLEQGFDVNLTMGIHGGCIRLLTSRDSGVTSVTTLKGRAVGTSNMASPGRAFIAVLAAKRGLDPVSDIDWRVYPPDLLSVALQKGEIQAFSATDPIASVLRDRDNLLEVTNNPAGEFAHRTCCVLGIRGSLIRDERPVATAITEALQEARAWVAANPDDAGVIFAKFTKVAEARQLSAMLRTHDHSHHPLNADFRQEIVLYTQELKQAAVMKPATDPTKFADRVCVDVLGA